ncbi:MAG TPA: DNA primase [Candidatus Paceibacterota bacterium]|nr:DNA primase [Candidatus Paceibacterota bacterium]
MSSSVDQIKSRIDILTLVSSYMKLDRAGANWKGKCPFHSEKTPSFFVSPERGSYYCFGCGASGDIFTFVEEFEGLDFKGALRLLADRAGVQLEVYNKINKETESEKEKLYKAMEEATKYFENNLKENKQAQEYLKSRGLTDKTIKDFRIGYAILDWRRLYDFLKEKSFTDDEIEKAGLAKKPNDGQKTMYDRFRGRIMFPISDSSGRVIAFSGRIFPESVPTEVGTPTMVGAKYLNSPETPIFKKSAVLYGLDKAKQSIRKNDFSIIVEGQFDLILSHQAGFRNTVATSGTALSNSLKLEDNSINNLGLVSRLSQNIVFIFDADMAGFNASMRATPIALALFSDMNVKATQIPEGMDPADLISKIGPNSWREVIRNSKHIIEFLVDKYMLISKNNDLLQTKLEIENKIIPYLTLINNPVKKSHFISLISNKSGISENDIRERLKVVERELKSENREIEKMAKKEETMFRADYILRKLLGIIFWQKSLTESIINTNEVIHRLVLILNLEKEKLLESSKYNRGDLIFEAEVFYGGDPSHLKKDTEELLSNLEEERFKEKLGIKMRELRQSEEFKDTVKAKLILTEIGEINDKIQNIKNKKT